MHNNNRTPEWVRLRQTGGFSVRDEPGAITVSSLPPVGFSPRLIVGALALPVFLFFLCLVPTGQSAWIGVGIAGALVLNGFVPVWQGYGRAAYKVRFTSDGVQFFNMLGMSMGWLDRATIQQIAVEPHEISKTRMLYLHTFYGLDGYMPALPQTDPRRATQRNAVLLTAFAQPVHLDRFANVRAA